jgi:hypothetical protein
MGFDRWGNHFEGCYLSPDELDSRPGVYVVWCKRGGTWIILDVGESDNVNYRLNNHERADCWKQNCRALIYYSAVYISDPKERANLERYIRNTEEVICGKI